MDDKADYSAQHSIDDDYVNPIFKMDDYYDSEESSKHFGSVSPLTSTEELFMLNHSNKIAQATGSIRYHANTPFLWNGYTSDEEVASPVENDDRPSFDSSNSDCESVLSFGDGPYHAQTCNNATQLCSRAQAVQVVSAGKPKVVKTPKLIDTSITPRAENNASEFNIRPGLLGINPSPPGYGEEPDNGAGSASPRSPGDRTQSSSVASQEPEARRRLQKPALPKLELVPYQGSVQTTCTSPMSRTPRRARRIYFLDSGANPVDNAFHLPTPSPSISPTRNKKHKISASFSFKNFGRIAKRVTLPDSSKAEAISDNQVRVPADSALISDMHIASRTSSKPPPKMIPRGGNERAPPIVLPPCPDDYVDDFDVTPWSPSTETTRRPAEVSAAIKRERRKTLSAIVSTQA